MQLLLLLSRLVADFCEFLDRFVIVQHTYLYGKLKLNLLALLHQVSKVQRVVVAENRLEDKVSTLGQEDG